MSFRNIASEGSKFLVVNSSTIAPQHRRKEFPKSRFVLARGAKRTSPGVPALARLSGIKREVLILKKLFKASLLVVALLVWMATPLLAQDDIIIHFSGYGYETDGFEWSYPSDELHLISHVTSITGTVPPPYDPVGNEYTLVVTGLISNGEIDEGGGFSSITYNLGLFEIYEDPSFNSDWAEYPSIATPPSTFFDGSVWLTGPFNDFTMTLYRDIGQAAFEGHIQLSGGSAFSWFTEDAYTFGGSLVPPHNPGFPAGYDLSIDGEVWVEPAVATEASSMSLIKALY